MTKPLPGIDHVVVLMFENRSFDNIFGGLYPASNSFHGLTGKEWNYNPRSPGVGTWTVWQSDASTAGQIPFPDPGEEFTDMNLQLFETASPSSCPSPTMAGFAANYARQPWSRPDYPYYPARQPVPKDIMQYYSERFVPTSYSLARSNAVCDEWFAAAPVQTLCNRTFTHTGTPSKKPNTDDARINNSDYTTGLSFRKIIEGDFEPPVKDKTIFEMLDDKYPEGRASSCSDLFDPDADRALNWKVYYHDAPLSALCSYVYDHWCFDTLYGGNVFQFSNFKADAERGRLPKYSFIEPAYVSLTETANSNHPGGSRPDLGDLNKQNYPPPVDIKHGEELLAAVVKMIPSALRDSTLLIVTYDEHGGLYDHIKPGPAVSPFTTPVNNFNYRRYGVRVPTILVHPRVKGPVFRASDGVRKSDGCYPHGFDTQLDHTSIIRTLCEQFDLGPAPTPRAAAAATLRGALRAQGDGEPREPAWDVLMKGAAVVDARTNARRELGRDLWIRNWFGTREVDHFDGDSINNAIVATFAIEWYGRTRWSSYALDEILDMEPGHRQALAAVGVESTRALLDALAEDPVVVRFADYLGVEQGRLLRWRSVAELLRVQGLLGDDAQLLSLAGVESREQLARACVDELHAQLTTALDELGLSPGLVWPELVKQWIAAAAPC